MVYFGLAVLLLIVVAVVWVIRSASKDADNDY